jgi:hypothetical protein
MPTLTRNAFHVLRIPTKHIIHIKQSAKCAPNVVMVSILLTTAHLLAIRYAIRAKRNEPTLSLKIITSNANQINFKDQYFGSLVITKDVINVLTLYYNTILKNFIH